MNNENKTNINWDMPTFVNYLQNTYKQKTFLHFLFTFYNNK